MCKRKSKKTNTHLPFKFWNTKEWKPDFMNQVIAANKLLKKFSLKAILKTLELPKFLWVYSLRTKNLTEEIAKQQRFLDRQTDSLSEPDISKEVNQLSKPKFNKPSTLSKLRNLDK